MPLINETYDSLPYIDTDLIPTTRAEITALLSTELQNSDIDTSIPHPLLPSLPDTKFSPAITQELERLEKDSNSKIQGGIDLSRYEALDPPTTFSKEEWQKSLNQAQTSHSYLSDRLKNLALLEQFGRNAWLVGNDGLEGVLGGVQRELGERKRGIDGVVGERQSRQVGVGGEVGGLEGTWRRGVGRVVEVSVAVEGVRGEVLGARRRRAEGEGRGEGMDVDG